MELVLSALETTGTPFEGFTVRQASIDTTDIKSLWSVLNELSEEGLVDSYLGGGSLIIKSSEKGEKLLVDSQGKGHYRIKFEEGESVCRDATALRYIFYSAFRRLLASKGFRTGRKSYRGVASPVHNEPMVQDFVLSKSADNVFLQGFRYALEIRKGGKGLLWVDPRVSIFNTFAGRFLSKSETIGAGLVLELRRLSILEPRIRLAKARSLVSFISQTEHLDVEAADGTKSSFSKDFITVKEA